MINFDITSYVVAAIIIAMISIAYFILKYVKDKVLAYVIIIILFLIVSFSGLFYYIFTGCMTTNTWCLGLIYNLSLIL